jgi:glycosyltransferase involved in cell wall biosynthesis
MNVQYIGPSLDYSGYGEACRNDIGALVSQGIEVSCRIPRYTREQADYQEMGKIVSQLEDRPLDYFFKIIHTTPDQFKKFHEPGKYNIGRVIWETTKLPPEFAENCHLMDEVWTASEFNKQAILDSGVTKPIFVIPEAISTTVKPESIKPYHCKADRTFAFYSIFEWTERKNPDALLRAYWSEFTDKDDVSLVIKTYVDDFSVTKRQEISQAIGAIKAALNQKYYPPVYLYRDLMDRPQVYRFHRSFHCFVSTHRGEGWGVPQMEAMLLGKPIISSNVGGIHEYLTHKKDALLLPVEMIPVTNTRNTHWYLPDQKWGKVEIQDVRKTMRWAYDNKDKAEKIGQTARKTVLDKFSFDAVGKLMFDRLNLIMAGGDQT